LLGFSQFERNRQALDASGMEFINCEIERAAASSKPINELGLIIRISKRMILGRFVVCGCRREQPPSAKRLADKTSSKVFLEVLCGRWIAHQTTQDPSAVG
jgi:hypothetical protein